MKAIEKALEISSTKKLNLMKESIKNTCCPVDFDIILSKPEYCDGIWSLKECCNKCWEREIV